MLQVSLRITTTIYNSAKSLLDVATMLKTAAIAMRWLKSIIDVPRSIASWMQKVSNTVLHWWTKRVLCTMQSVSTKQLNASCKHSRWSCWRSLTATKMVESSCRYADRQQALRWCTTLCRTGMRDSRSNASRQRIDQMRRNRTDAGQYRGESSSHSRRAAAIHKGAHNPSTQTTQSRAAQRRGKGTHTVEHRQSLVHSRSTRRSNRRIQEESRHLSTSRWRRRQSSVVRLDTAEHWSCIACQRRARWIHQDSTPIVGHIRQSTWFFFIIVVGVEKRTSNQIAIDAATINWTETISRSGNL